MTDHIANRNKLLHDLRRELVGPDPAHLGKEQDFAAPLTVNTYQEMYGPWIEKGTLEEVISRDTPTKRYGVGVLYPPSVFSTSSEPDPDLTGQVPEAQEDSEQDETNSSARAGTITADTEKRAENITRIEGRSERKGMSREDDGAAEFDVSGANSYRPSAMAVSFLALLPVGGKIVVSLPTTLPEDHAFGGMPVNGRYTLRKTLISGKDKEGKFLSRQSDVWIRRQVTMKFELPVDEVLANGHKVFKLEAASSSENGKLDLRLEILARPRGQTESSNHRLLTVNLVNRAVMAGHGAARLDALCLFQAYFDVSIWNAEDHLINAVLPYPTPARQDEEEQSNTLLYRNALTFAAGHGCAADWRGEIARVRAVRAECLPVYELPSITPDISQRDGTPISVSMRGLAGLDPEFDIPGKLTTICDLYEMWISDRKTESKSLDSAYRKAASRHLQDCQEALDRMRAGLLYLQSNPEAMQAFKWANLAVLLQQLRGDIDLRTVRYDEDTARLQFADSYPAVSNQPKGTRGSWRAFQIAFLLLAVQSSAEGSAPDREVADLIWFPTGGGKTEAYLGLTAFSLFMRRLRDPNDSGVHVLMRYTLRLLTAQQFQRATGLICAMEYVRRLHPTRLGETPFSAGIWLGGSTTPNDRKSARQAFGKLNRGDAYAENPFMITKCPWCGAQIGPLRHQGKTGEGKSSKFSRGRRRSQQSTAPNVAGYEDDGTTIRFRCTDSLCDFARSLPVYVIDEDVYKQRPSLVIGTVDKFAMLAWRPEARALFGLGSEGERICSPPGLIIQDELHLISGPLGSMSGLYEPVIEELCTDRRSGKAIKPKLVCSTATIRAYREQIRALYGRNQAALFPPPGLDVADSFFSRYALNPDNSGKLAHGRIYVGVNGPGHGSLQTTQVRTFSALLQSPFTLDDAGRDPWWTLLTFFNSLRELGTTLTLFQSDIPDYFKVIRNRNGLDIKSLRSLWNIQELTGRLNSEEVPRAIQELERRVDSSEKGSPVDVCLASNIIEVGIDIGRLSVMAIVGQPKTTAQYIQVSGRVGRRWEVQPGLVTIIYNASKPRDRSHFEKFRTYHQQLYAQVEPTSVTPFSPQALQRALHAAMVA